MNEERIIVDPKTCHGQPCFKGTRIMIYLVLELLEAGISPKKIISDYYPNITLEDIQAATSPSYIESIKEARAEYNKGKVLFHKEVYNKSSNKKKRKVKHI